jgi:hypothetical protein
MGCAFGPKDMWSYSEFRTRQDGPRKPDLFSPHAWAAIQLEAHIVHFADTATHALPDFTCPHLKTATEPWAWFCHHPPKVLFWGELQCTQIGGLWASESLDKEAT